MKPFTSVKPWSNREGREQTRPTKQLLSERFRAGSSPPAKALNPAQFPFIAAVRSKLERGEFPLIPNECPCGSPANDVIISEIDRYGLPLNAVLCQACGTVRINPYLDHAGCAEFYSKYYQQMYGRIDTLPDYFARQQSYGERILKALTWLQSSRQRVLEVGCGAGGALTVFRKAGHEVAGCEYSGELLDYARKQGLKQVYEGPLEAVPEPAAGYDLIILHHVFEHLDEPLEFLQTARRYVSKQGRILIVVPDIANIDQFAYPGGDLLPFLHIAHKHNFTVRGFELLCQRAGFGVQVLPTPHPVADLWIECSLLPSGAENDRRVNSSAFAFCDRSPGQMTLAYLKEVETARKIKDSSKCPVCGGVESILWRIARDRLLRVTEVEFAYLQCKACGAFFQAAPPPPGEMAHYYPEDYGPYAGQLKPAQSQGSLHKALKKLSAFESRTLNEHLEELYRPASVGLQLLDYGCGSDKFLNRARKKGWQTIGVDFAPSVLETVKASGHRAYLADEEVWQGVPDESTSVIRMNHVIEHLYAPGEVLKNLFRKLTRGGQLHIATPNPAGLGSRLFRSRWLGLDCPRHIVLFPPAVLARLLKETGFTQLEVIPEFVTKDLARSIGYYLVDAGLIKHEAVSGLMHKELLSAALALPCLVSVKLGWPDRYHIIAKKS